VPAAGAEAVDVSGAGDTAAAAFTLALAAGLDGASALRLANAAAGVVVMEPGAAACPLDRLRSALPLAPLPRAAGAVKA
jgi:D-beta-D-heptose 7-phosphate kinase/D-beta-D-heptose 1-phosphate adenosyltransferase